MLYSVKYFKGKSYGLLSCSGYSSSSSNNSTCFFNCYYCYGNNCRQLTKHSSYGGRRTVFYVAPCRRRLRNESEVDHYLVITDSQLTIDFFCFDAELRVDVEFMSKQVWIDMTGSADCYVKSWAVPVGAGGGYMFSGRPSVRSSVRASVRPSMIHMVVLCFRDISSICWRIFAKLLSLVLLGTEMNWLDFGVKRSNKVQGHAIPAEAHSTRRYRRVFSSSRIVPSCSVSKRFRSITDWTWNQRHHSNDVNVR